MKRYKNKTYITTNEYIDLGGLGLEAIGTLSIGGTRAPDWIKDVYGERYFAIPYTNDLLTFSSRLITRLTAMKTYLAGYETAYMRLRSSAGSDVVRTRTENKLGPDGGSDFYGAYSQGGILQTTDDANSAGKPEVAKEYAEALIDISSVIVDQFEKLYMPDSDWGCNIA